MWSISFVCWCLFAVTIRDVHAGIYRAKRLDGYVLRTFINLSVNKCKVECTHRRACLSYNYNRYHKICELNGEAHANRETHSSSETLETHANRETRETHANSETREISGVTLSEDTKWIYETVEKDGSMLMKTCDVSICMETEVCRRVGDTEKCMSEECPPYKKTSTHQIVHGNMNTIGSVLTFSCPADHTVIGDTTAVCNKTGQWENMNHNCIQQCPNFDNFIQTNEVLVELVNIYTEEENIQNWVVTLGWPIGYSIVLENSYVRYFCLEFLLTNQYFTIYCFNGTWSYATGCYDSHLDIPCHPNISDLNSLCSCPLGTLYHYRQFTCVTRCGSIMAASYTKHPNVAFLRPDFIFHTNYTALVTDCMALCSATLNCKSFQYGNNHCVFWDFVYADHPDDLNSSDADLYLRDCLGV
ncbi:hypothetical protein ACF0H5_024265 [Mactra antiquata]